MTPVERVARAMRADQEANGAGDTASAAIDWDRAARAAIEAMREPTIEMVAAFWRQKNCGTQEIGEVGDARSDFDAFRAAIDAALQEPTP